MKTGYGMSLGIGKSEPWLGNEDPNGNCSPIVPGLRQSPSVVTGCNDMLFFNSHFLPKFELC